MAGRVTKPNVLTYFTTVVPDSIFAQCSLFCLVGERSIFPCKEATVIAVRFHTCRGRTCMYLLHAHPPRNPRCQRHGHWRRGPITVVHCWGRNRLRTVMPARTLNTNLASKLHFVVWCSRLPCQAFQKSVRRCSSQNETFF